MGQLKVHCTVVKSKADVLNW